MRGHIAHTLAAVLLVVSLGAAQRPASSVPGKTQNMSIRAKLKTTKPYQIGTASWYGDYFQGKATASGEPYNMYDLTAAHPTLPLGSWVRVTNLRNGRAVVVRINDRGPVVPAGSSTFPTIRRECFSSSRRDFNRYVWMWSARNPHRHSLDNLR